LASRFDIGHLQTTTALSKRIRDASPHQAAASRPLYRRIPWLALVVSVAVILSSAFTVNGIWDAATHAEISEGSLVKPVGYVVLGPLAGMLDMLTLLSARQHIALVLGIIVVFATWRAVRAATVGSTRRQHVVATAILLAGIVVVYLATAVLPRPMAALVVENANIIRVDFHSHTSASHDGRPGWNAERNREWHRDAGFDVVYVTDHAAVGGAEQGMARNPSPAGEGVTILQGVEVTWTGEHVAILGAERSYKGILTTNLRDVDEQGLRLASLIPDREPVVIWNHPHRLNRLPIASGPGTAGVRAVELSNGAPDSMDEVRHERAAIVALGEQKNLMMTGGTDNHGWGRTSPTWTLMVLFNWRTLSGDALGAQIEKAVRQGGVGASRVVERRVADGTGMVGLTFTVFTAPARMLTTLSNDERISWLLWIWLATVAVWWLRRRRASDLSS
jgi:hypothetical protein